MRGSADVAILFGKHWISFFLVKNFGERGKVQLELAMLLPREAREEMVK